MIEKINENENNTFQYINLIFEIIGVIPTSNAVVERGFSAMKRIKNLLRNKLKI